MISKFTKPLLLSSALTLGSLGFVACSEDNGTNSTTQPGSSSSIVPIDIPEDSPETSIIFNGLGISSIDLNKAKFKGSLTIDFSDYDPVGDLDLIEAIRFTKVQFDIINAAKTVHGTPTYKELDLVNNKYTTLNLAELGLITNFSEDFYGSQCGEYLLIVTAVAEDGWSDPSVSKDTIPFVRPEESCKVPESSSSSVSVPGAPLSAIEVSVNTRNDKCLDIATGTASANTTGDICFTRVGATVQLSSTTGLKFAVYDNQNDDEKINDYSKNWLPEQAQETFPDQIGAPTTDSFLYDEANLKENYPDFINEGDVFFVAVAPTFVQGASAGFYAFIVTEVSTPDANGDLTIKLRIYKG